MLCVCGDLILFLLYGCNLFSHVFSCVMFARATWSWYVFCIDILPGLSYDTTTTTLPTIAMPVRLVHVIFVNVILSICLHDYCSFVYVIFVYVTYFVWLSCSCRVWFYIRTLYMADNDKLSLSPTSLCLFLRAELLLESPFIGWTNI